MTPKTIKVLSSGISGLEAHLVEVEIAHSVGTIHFQLIGLPDSAVKESAHRVMSALVAEGLPSPHGPLLVNLAPAATRKQGSALDLALALGVTAAADGIPPASLKGTMVFGELSLNGMVKPVGGAFLAGCLARKMGLERIICPEAEAEETALAAQKGTNVWGVQSLLQAAQVLAEEIEPPKLKKRARIPLKNSRQFDLSDVRGQEKAIRGLLVAAAGGHHLLLVGPPGAGKSYLSHRLPGILPPLGEMERVEVTRIRSAAGLPVAALAQQRPFRAPHHTVSYAGMVGGGSDPGPGEVTLSHRGVLFLDELAEFERRTLEVLRQPLESGCVHLGRARISRCYPARFQLIAAMNPCPCGYLGHPLRPCRCLPRAVASYQGRISGPLRDRLDLQLWIPPVEPEELLPVGGNRLAITTTAQTRAKVEMARHIQKERLQGEGYLCNGEIPTNTLDRVAALDRSSRQLLLHALKTLGLSARGLVRIRRVARTIADLDQEEHIREEHILEALAFRQDKKSSEH